MSKYAGIDPSLTGAAVVTYDTDTGEKSVVSFSSKPDKGTIKSRLERIDSLSDKIVEAVVKGTLPTAVGIEGPAYSSNTGKVWDRAGLWWSVIFKLDKYDLDVYEVPPTMRAKFASGKGNAGKDEVLLAAARTYPDFDFKTNDQADALVICALIARAHDEPFDGGLPKTNLDAIIKFKKDNK